MADYPVGFGRYQLVEALAVGGMAELFVATSPGEHGFQKKVVIKRLLPALSFDETYQAMFIDEAKLTAKLLHPKIAQTLELGRVDDALYIAMEYVEGIDVLALLREFASRKRRLEPQLAAWIAHEVLDALDYAHNLVDEGSGRPFGIVHRDISPSNVLLSIRGFVKLVDFGIARAKDPDRAHKSKTGTLKGKYGYMSPEQVIELPLDQRSDLFSVGVVLAEMLTGRRLFAAANELDVLLMVRDAKLQRFDKYGADLEPGLQQIVRKALKKPVDERWQTAGAFRDAIAEWLFEQRHRMSNKDVAPVVSELLGAAHDRKLRASAPAGTLPAAVAGAAGTARRPTTDDGVPQIVIEPIEDISMPVISVTYAEELAPRGRTTGRAETMREYPPPVREQPVLGGPLRDTSGAVEIPIADTISAAVEAIVLPDPPSYAVGTSAGIASGSVVAAVSPSANTEPLRAGTLEPLSVRAEDSQIRSFDDLTEAVAARSREIALPSAEELARKKPPPPPELADIAGDPEDVGELSQTSPLRVLFRLMTARSTGLLVVAVGGIKKEIYVRDGQPEYVSSNVANELFGNYLVTKGVLSDGELAMALAMMPHYGGKLGDTLVGLGLLKPLEVFRHLTRQVRAKIIDVCTWNKGGFAWYPGRENPREAFPLDFNAFEILGAGAMALSDDDTAAWIARHGAVKLRASRARRVGPERFEVKGLVDLFARLDGRRSVDEIVEAETQRADRLRVGRMLCLLEACDLARP